MKKNQYELMEEQIKESERKINNAAKALGANIALNSFLLGWYMARDYRNFGKCPDCMEYSRSSCPLWEMQERSLTETHPDPDDRETLNLSLLMLDLVRKTQDKAPLKEIMDLGNCEENEVEADVEWIQENIWNLVEVESK